MSLSICILTRLLGLISGWGRSSEGGNATHSSILAWKIPWTEEPDELQSKVSDMTEHTHWVFATLILY